MAGLRMVEVPNLEAGESADQSVSVEVHGFWSYGCCLTAVQLGGGKPAHWSASHADWAHRKKTAASSPRKKVLCTDVLRRLRVISGDGTPFNRSNNQRVRMAIRWASTSQCSEIP
jgi:hypothetical protein